MGSILLYVIAIFYTLYIGVLYNSVAGILIFFIELMIPCFLYILLYFQRSKVHVKLNIPVTVVEKDKMIHAEIKIKNDSIMPITKFTMVFIMEHTFTNKKEKVQIKSSVAGRQEQTIVCELKSNTCGSMNVFVKRIRIYEGIGIFYQKIKKVESDQVLIYPSIYDTRVEISEYVRRFPVESNRYDEHQKGEDSSEIFQIREYQSGDKIQSIHWKLSARTEAYIVKEYSLPIGCAVVFLIDWIREETYLEIIASISLAMIEAECFYYAAWFDPVCGDLVRKEVKNFEDGYDMIRLLMQTSESKESYNMLEDYQEKYRGETFAAAVMLNRKFDLFVNERLVFQFNRKGIKEQLSSVELKL